MVVRFNYDPSLNYSVDHGISMRYHEMEHDYQHFNIKFEPAKYHTADTIFPVNSKDRNTVLIPPLYAYKTWVHLDVQFLHFNMLYILTKLLCYSYHF